MRVMRVETCDDDPGGVLLVLHSGQWVRRRGQGYWRVGRRLSIEVVSVDEDTGKAATAHEADDLIFVVVAKMDGGLSRRDMRSNGSM
jgi:hypothetical protein